MPRFLQRLLARTGWNASPVRRTQTRWLRLKLEALEERSNPVTLSFVPFTAVAANPSALPPTSILQFNPLPQLSGILTAASAFQGPVNLHGDFQQTLVPPVSATAVNPAGHLDVNYDLLGSVTGTVTPPGPTATQPGALSATFNLIGRFTEVLNLPGPAPQPPWVITGTFTEKGTVSGPLLPPLAGSTAVDVMTFNATISVTQSEIRPVSATALGVSPWAVQATIQSGGNFQIRAVPPPASAALVPLAVPFSVQDQITAAVSPVSSTALPPQPPIKIAGVDNASGTVTEIAFPPGSPIVPPIFSGTTSYQQLLTETITYPPGPTNPGSPQSVTAALDTSGTFLNIPIVPVPLAEVDLPEPSITASLAPASAPMELAAS